MELARMIAGDNRASVMGIKTLLLRAAGHDADRVAPQEPRGPVIEAQTLFIEPMGADTLAGSSTARNVTYRGRAFSADRVALEFTAPRPGMPIHLAAMADRSLALCGRLADGLIVSNLCPPAYTARAVAIVRESAAVAGRESIASSPSGIRRLTARAKYAASAVGCGPANSAPVPLRRHGGTAPPAL
jgi:alkanesulfonate monooxygenase SsuD/methylene tetrahydromethanopterin reductase-like flavin-dependent oxidoreductase (luciferase family)